ncbi:hypothetical protein [Hymenobacter lucidus]|uniref:hypothetical protein n=1 Tax=Hymenobacter lucidus TaxID=2880930 RepID=UPI001CF49803|nr:hypothetical protein [Hymenobacter lucidus]
MEYKRFRAQNQGFQFLIEADKSDVGAYLYVFKGAITEDYLEDSVEKCQKRALQHFGVPLDAWKPIKSVFV